jgi:hypothetical protein
VSTQGIIVIDVLGLCLLGLIVNLTRTRKLYVAYGIVWFLAASAVIVLVSIPPMLDLVTRAVGALFPASALSLLAFVFIFVVLIFFSVQLSTLSARQAELIQVLALREALAREAGGAAAAGHPTSGAGS